MFLRWWPPCLSRRERGGRQGWAGRNRAQKQHAPSCTVHCTLYIVRHTQHWHPASASVAFTLIHCFSVKFIILLFSSLFNILLRQSCCNLELVSECEWMEAERRRPFSPVWWRRGDICQRVGQPGTTSVLLWPHTALYFYFICLQADQQNCWQECPPNSPLLCTGNHQKFMERISWPGVTPRLSQPAVFLSLDAQHPSPAHLNRKPS